MAAQQKRPEGGTQGPRQQVPQSPRFWWLIFIVLLVWDLVVFLPRPYPEASIPYSTFLAERMVAPDLPTEILGANRATFAGM
jgi:hypothetical protein